MTPERFAKIVTFPIAVAIAGFVLMILFAVVYGIYLEISDAFF